MFKNYKMSYLPKDILSGIIVALISIPISMGYAQVAGLPVVYGLYGSLLPVLVFGVLSSSPQFVFGVDAAPAALVGGLLASLGIATGTEEAMEMVPVITLVTACWLMIFYVLKAGRLVNYISKPVLGGFISGIGCTIILMQVSKLFGGAAASGEVFVLVAHIAGQLKYFNLLSFGLSIGTIAVILLAKKYVPKLPMSVVILVLSVVLQMKVGLDRYGVKLLPAVDKGLPEFKVVRLEAFLKAPEDIIAISFTIALVIVSSTLLTACNYAIKYDYKLNNNREILAYSLSNGVAAFLGCCPLNGSVSRTGIADQFGCKSQLMSVTAAFTMLLVLLFGTDLIQYMPVPVLTAIVVSALIGILEFGMAKKLWKSDKREFAIFVAAFLGVLLFGTIYGVVIGVCLSFLSVVLRASVPPKAYLGVIPGQEGFFNLDRNRNAHEIKGAVIYRFSGSLFFANIDAFQQDLESAVKDDTFVIVVDASGIGSVDITATDRLLIMAENYRKKGIRFYITEHVGALNDQLRQLGAEGLIKQGCVRRTVTLALRDAGVERPYPLLDRDGIAPESRELERSEKLSEFEWAFGDNAEQEMEALTLEVANQMVENGFEDEEAIAEAEARATWGRIGLFDEDELLDRLEMHLSDIVKRSDKDAEYIESRIEKRRIVIERKLQKMNPEALENLSRHRRRLEQHFQRVNPEAYEHMLELRRKHIEDLEKSDPELAEKMKKHYNMSVTEE